jgi:hypothetical protein
MRRWIIAGVALGIGFMAWRGRHHAAPPHKGALAAAMLAEVAASDSRVISWNTYDDVSSATLWQHDGAELRGNAAKVFVETDSWKLELSLSNVFAVTCYVTGGEHGYPEYGFMTFQPAGGDVFDALFTVGFPGGSIDALERICAKHGIPVER